MITKMELEGMKNGAFPMDKPEGIAACREYRKALEAEGKTTWLEHFANGIFLVRSK